MKQRWITLSLLTLFLTLLSSAAIYFFFIPVVPKRGLTIYFLQTGTTKKTLAVELTDQKIIPFPWLFYCYAYLHPHTPLKTGEYLLHPGATQFDIWQQVTKGKGIYYRRFTIIPGWTFIKLRHALAKNPWLSHTSITWPNEQIMQYLGKKGLSPEGQFFPETYFFSRGTSDTIILKKAFSMMQNQLTRAWQNRMSNLPYQNPYDALIVASLVEREAYLASERSIIAGVIVNRLQKNMLLQIDPTVIYGLGEKYVGKLHKSDLLADTPYNTYLHKGLPPTPIAMPSLSSIDAALHPTQHPYFYFVAKGDGSHQFSTTLKQHNNAVFSAIMRKRGYFNENAIEQYLQPLIKVGGPDGQGQVN